MSEENGTIEEPVESSVSEATAAAAAFSSARNEEVAETVVEPVEPEVVEPVVETPPEPKRFAGRTEEEIEALLGEIPTIKDSYRKQIDNLAGNYGSLKSAFQKLQQDTPRGEAVEVTDDDLSDMNREFPELAGMTKVALNNVLKRINLRGGGAPESIDIDGKVNTLVGDIISKERVAIHTELLDGLAPGWKEIVGMPDKPTDYRKWLAAQPADYQNRINNSNNAFEISGSVKSFQSAQEAAAKRQSQNKQRLTNAIQPAGSVAARSVISEQQAADAAFKRERGR